MRNKQNRILLSYVKILLGSFNINKRERAELALDITSAISNNLKEDHYTIAMKVIYEVIESRFTANGEGEWNS